MSADDAGDDVGGTTRRKANHDLDGPVGIGLRHGGRGGEADETDREPGEPWQGGVPPLTRFGRHGSIAARQDQQPIPAPARRAIEALPIAPGIANARKPSSLGGLGGDDGEAHGHVDRDAAGRGAAQKAALARLPDRRHHPPALHTFGLRCPRSARVAAAADLPWVVTPTRNGWR